MIIARQKRSNASCCASSTISRIGCHLSGTRSCIARHRAWNYRSGSQTLARLAQDSWVCSVSSGIEERGLPAALGSTARRGQRLVRRLNAMSTQSLRAPWYLGLSACCRFRGVRIANSRAVGREESAMKAKVMSAPEEESAPLRTRADAGIHGGLWPF